MLSSEDQVHAWHLPHQNSALSSKNCLLPAIFSKPVPFAPKAPAILSSACPGVWVESAFWSSGESTAEVGAGLPCDSRSGPDLVES